MCLSFLGQARLQQVCPCNWTDIAISIFEKRMLQR